VPLGTLEIRSVEETRLLRVDNIKEA
jgi:hypothetical protein